MGLCALVTACGSSDNSAPTGADASGPGVESGAETTTPCLAPSALGLAARSSDGVLTNHPAFHFTKTGGNLDITSAYFELTVFPDFNSLVAWGDVQNETGTQQCAPYVDQFAVGMLGAVTVIDGPAYELPGSQVSYICLEPGGRAIFRTIQNNGVPATALDGELTISYSFTGIPFAPPNRRHPDDPHIVSVSPKQDPLGWRVSGQMRAGPMSVHTLQVRVYIRDPNGLLYKDFQLKPGAGHTIVADSLFDFETDPTPAEFCSYEIFNRFIDGPELQPPDAGPNMADGGVGD